MRFVVTRLRIGDSERRLCSLRRVVVLCHRRFQIARSLFRLQQIRVLRVREFAFLQ